MRLVDLSVVIIETVDAVWARDLIDSCITGFHENTYSQGEQFVETPHVLTYQHGRLPLQLSVEATHSEPNSKRQKKVILKQDFLSNSNEEIFVFDVAQKYLSESKSTVEAIGINPIFLLMENGGGREWLKQQCVGGEAFANCDTSILPREIKLTMEKWESRVEFSLLCANVPQINKTNALIAKVNMDHKISHNETEKILSSGKQKLDAVGKFFADLAGESA